MRQEHFHQLFEFSVVLKGLHALIELATGAAVLSLSPFLVANFLVTFAVREQQKGWPAFAVDFLLHVARAAVSGGQHFAGIYLLAVGVINLGLVIGLLTSRLWAFPAALAAIAVLMAYQLYRYTHTHAVVLIFLTLFDAVVWWLVRHEYLELRSRIPAAQQSSYSPI
ncbi:MAG TPA: DUF2127 domain-containing protein [Candidatus Acidoferrales bacterium]|nr:DUF2127 domain-containing protein [Candidatus Acidoferrales bacterium]